MAGKEVQNYTPVDSCPKYLHQYCIYGNADAFYLLIQGVLNDDAHTLYNVTHLLTLIRINNYTIHQFVPIHF